MLDRFVRYLEVEKGHTPKGIRQYHYDAQLWLAWLEERGLVSSPEAVRVLLEEKRLSPRRAQGLMAAIRAYYRFLGEPDPTEGVGRPRAGRRIPRYPSRKDLEHLLEVAADEPEAELLRALLPFLYGTGLRISEALSLRLEHLIHEDRRPVALRVIGKGDRERLVPLSPMARQALEGWLAVRGNTRGSLWVYRRKRYAGRRVGISWLEKRLADLARRAGLEPSACSPHKFRHAYASALVEAGVGLDAVKDLLGHSHIATTQIYLHSSYGRLRRAVEALR